MKNTSLCFLFQFHKGTIRTFFFCMNAFPKQLFQFHKGTIRTVQIHGRGVVTIHFNSIKVQLELFLVNSGSFLIIISIP